MITYHEIEQRSHQWFDLRKAKITGSKFKDIIDHKTGMLKKETASRTPLFTAACKIIAEIQTGQPLETENDFKSFAMEWGEEMETLIFEKYDHKSVKEIGFVYNDEYKYFGISPDRLYFKGEHAIDALEGKGPNSDTFIAHRLWNKVPDTAKQNHKPQVLMYFSLIPTLEKLKFVSHDPRNLVEPWFEVTVTREELSPIIEQCQLSMKEFETIVDGYLEQLNHK